MLELILEQENDSQSYGFYAYNILKTIANKFFKEHKTLSCLTKSETFLKELLNTFNKLYFCNISPQKFLTIIQNLNVSCIDKERLNFLAKVYSEYIKIMEANDYTVPLCSGIASNTVLTELDIKKIFDDLDNYSCVEFQDVHSECIYVLNNIKELLNTGVKYNDIAIFADKAQMRQKILDILKAEDIPVKSSIYNQEYENLKYKINLFVQMADILKILDIQEFSINAIKNTSVLSRAQKEIKFEELDELVKMFLFEIVMDSYTLDKIFIKKESSTKTLLEILYSNINILSEMDRDSLNREFGLFKHFYELYLTNNYFEAIKLLINSKISKFEEPELKKTILRKLKSLEQLQNLYDVVLNTTPDFNAFMGIMEWLGIDKSRPESLILESISSDISKKQKFKYVFVIGLTENNFPGTNVSYPFISEDTNIKLSEKLKLEASNFDGFIRTDNVFYSQKLIQIENVIKSATERLILTTHTYEVRKKVQPSFVFDIASQNEEKYIRINNQPSQNDIFSKIELEERKLQKENIVKNMDILRLSPSSITTFQNCPQKYFYKHLLNLKEPYSFSASYGSIVHAVFEVLNKNFLTNNQFTKDVALELGNILFDAKNNIEKALNIGFKQMDIDLVNEASDLALAEMKEDFINAIEDFSLSGGFDNPPKSAICEKTFEFSIPELPNVIFDGRIDAILENNNGGFCVVDYKTGHNKVNTLEYAISENGVNFLLKTGKEPANPETLQNAYDYQIPIYYLATQYAEELSNYKNNICELGLVYVRPKSKDNGCSEDMISAETLSVYKDKIVQNLKETVIDKILNTKEFQKKKSFFCNNCAYKFLCDLEDNDD